jgi:hypothetical protein
MQIEEGARRWLDAIDEHQPGTDRVEFGQRLSIAWSGTAERGRSGGSSSGPVPSETSSFQRSRKAVSRMS